MQTAVVRVLLRHDSLFLRLILNAEWCLRGEGGQSFVVDAHGAPFHEHNCTHLLVEADGGSVPFEDIPLQALATFGDGDCRDLGVSVPGHALRCGPETSVTSPLR
jgi:hypothetical protein